jgi:ABC-2 type transport system permease protein
MFFSSAFFPRETMSGWFKVLADLNPISYLVEAMRDQIIEPEATSATLTGLGVALALAAIALLAANSAFRHRLEGDQ